MVVIVRIVVKHFHPILELTNDLNGLNVLNDLNLNLVMIVEMVMFVKILFMHLYLI